MVRRLMPAGAPFDLLPWEPCVHLGLFVHRCVIWLRGCI